MPRKGEGAGAEKRRATRMHIEAPVTIWPVHDGVPGAAAKVLTRDLSYSGIGFLQAGAEKPAGQFLLQLPRTKATPVLLLCHITFARLLADNLHVVGAEFERLLAPQKEAKAAQAAHEAQTAAAAIDALCEKLAYSATDGANSGHGASAPAAPEAQPAVAGPAV